MIQVAVRCGERMNAKKKPDEFDPSLPIKDKIRLARKMKDMTQQELSMRTGMTVTAISGLENGRRPTPRIDTIQRLSKALEVDLMAIEASGSGAVTTEYVQGSLLKFLRSPLAKSLKISAKEKKELAELKWFNPKEKPTDLDWADWIRLRRRVRAINGG